MENTNTPTDNDLLKLEQRVDELIDTCSHLGKENRTLKAQQEKLVAERAALIEKTELARSRVEAMITRLKALESGS
jgi:cell division protein ZapB